MRSLFFKLRLITFSAPALLPAARRRSLPYALVSCPLYLGMLPFLFHTLWPCQLLLPRTAVVWMCSGSKREPMGSLCLSQATRLQLPWRPPLCVCLNMWEFVLLISGLSCESRLYPRTALYVCAPVLLAFCCWLGHICYTVPFCVVSPSSPTT